MQEGSGRGHLEPVDRDYDSVNPTTVDVEIGNCKMVWPQTDTDGGDIYCTPRIRTKTLYAYRSVQFLCFSFPF